MHPRWFLPLVATLVLGGPLARSEETDAEGRRGLYFGAPGGAVTVWDGKDAVLYLDGKRIGGGRLDGFARLAPSRPSRPALR